MGGDGLGHATGQVSQLVMLGGALLPGGIRQGLWGLWGERRGSRVTPDATGDVGWTGGDGCPGAWEIRWPPWKKARRGSSVALGFPWRLPRVAQ